MNEYASWQHVALTMNLIRREKTYTINLKKLETEIKLLFQKMDDEIKTVE